MTVRADVREMVSQQLDAAGLAVYSPADESTPWPIKWGSMPAQPDRAVVVSCYGLGGEHEQGVQVRVRGSVEDSTTAEDRGDLIRTQLHGLADLTHGDTTLVLLTFLSMADLGSDANGRDQVTVNFRAVTSDPNTALYY